jgi:hypothetical protein
MHGINRITAPYIVKQAETALGILINITIWGLALYMAWSGSFSLITFWVIVGGIFYMERIQSALGAGKKGVAIASTMVLDISFDMFISAVYVWCLIVAVKGGERGWGASSIDQLVVEGAH